MTDDSLLPFDLAAVIRKKVTAHFAGGSISTDGGLVLLREAERRLRLAEALAPCIREWREPALVVKALLACCVFACWRSAAVKPVPGPVEPNPGMGANGSDALRETPPSKLAVRRVPPSGRDLRSPRTMSRLESELSRSEVTRMTAAPVDIFCRSFPIPPAAIALTPVRVGRTMVNHTEDEAHGDGVAAPSFGPATPEAGRADVGRVASRVMARA